MYLSAFIMTLTDTSWCALSPIRRGNPKVLLQNVASSWIFNLKLDTRERRMFFAKASDTLIVFIVEICPFLNFHTFRQ